MAKHRRRRHGGGDPLLSEAKLEANVRYGPEERGLKQLLKEARQELSTGISGERGAAKGIQAAVDAARPEIRKSYARAGQDYNTADSEATQNLLKISGADQYKAVAVREQAAAKRRLADQLKGAENELTARKVQAEQTRAFGVGNALRQYSQDASKIQTQRQGLAGEKGQFTLATLKDLGAAQDKLRLENRKIRVQIRGQNVSRQNAEDRIKATTRGQDLQHADRRRANQIRAQGKTGKPKLTFKDKRTARENWRKGYTLVSGLKRDPKEGEGYVKFLVSKGVKEPLARGVVQTHLFGGVRPEQCRKIQGSYGLKPKVISNPFRRRAGGHANVGLG